jgi:hypothetical protein
MSDEQRHKTGSAWTRSRERRRVKRQMAIEREYHEPDRLDPATVRYTDADNPRQAMDLIPRRCGGIG